MAPRSAQKRKIQKSDASFLSKLQMLREFVPSFDETDLSTCLRQCGYNVELAAERLMTGQYKPASKTSGSSTFFAVNASIHGTNATTKETMTPVSIKRQKIVTSNSPSQHKKQSPIATVRATVSTDSGNGPLLLLCQRWVVGWNTTKLGRVNYQESLSLSNASQGPPMVRLRGQGIDATLQPNLCAMLSPLLRYEESKLLSVRVESLMEQRGLAIGDEVPISLTIFVADPHAFFGLFQETAPTGTAASQYFGSKSKSSKKYKRLPIASAAFALLQWAEYGEQYDFEVPKEKTEADTTSDDDDDDDGDSENEAVIMSEDQLDAVASEADKEKEASPEWAKTIVDFTSTESDVSMSLPEADDPIGFTGGVTLRPYQRQALHWMLQRESGLVQRDALDQQLKLLSELALNSAPVVVTNTKDPISCEVGPVRVSLAMAEQSRTIDGEQNPVNHPLWQRRYLATADRKSAISFYVNELIGVATAKPPNPPNQCIGGILADAMGLGKTVMLIALILTCKELSVNTQEKNDCDVIDVDEADDISPGQSVKPRTHGTTLVVAPLSLIAQWEEEFATKTSLTHKVYYAETARGRMDVDSLAGIDVVITTYGTIQGELHASLKKKSIESGLLSYNWERVILDEAHCIKNPSTLVSRACCLLKAEKRWCVTGTPIQNSLQDVYSLLKFLRHEPWCEAGFWKVAITSAKPGAEAPPTSETGTTAKGSSESAPDGNMPSGTTSLSRVRRLLAPLILRRTKDSVSEDGSPILTLPPIESATVHVELSPSEREFYNALKLRSQSVFEGFIKDGTATKSWFAIFALLNRLRQVCDHVALTVKSHMDDSDWNPSRSNSPVEPLEASPVAKKPKKTTNESDAFGEGFLEGLLKKFRTKQSVVKEKDQDDHTVPTSNNDKETNYASKVAHTLSMAVEAGATHIEEECALCLETPKIHDAVITPCAHIFCRDCLVGVLRDSANHVAAVNKTMKSQLQCPDGECPICKESIKASRIIALKSSDDGRTFTSFLTDTTHRMRFKAEPPTSDMHVGARQTLENALRGAGSAKLTAVINELYKVWEKDPGSKILVFSQFLGFLDLMEVSLHKRGIPFGRLDGKLSLKERVAVLDRFKEDSRIPNNDSNMEHCLCGSVLLVSMKAGGVGINLVAASSVFIVDPWWNAAVEDQCVNRIHRIGQTADVVRVRKFVVTDSVEERIVTLQRRKKDIACAVLSDVNNDDTLTNAQPTLDDLKLLFRN